MIVKSIRFGKESTPSHKRTEQTFEAKSAEWSPTSDRIRPLHGCLFEMQIPRDGLRCVFIHNVAVHSRQTRQRSAAVAKVTFGGGPIAVLERNTQLVTKCATRLDPKAFHHEQPARAAA